ncbi:MAG: DUF1223 domain-containing protein [Pyrinomonadaceae bacterium]
MKLAVSLLLIVTGVIAFRVLNFHRSYSAVNDTVSMIPSHKGGPVLIELFTSEGCSSCPPADDLLAKLNQQTVAGVEVIALAEHVDYWNDLGWPDPYSSRDFSNRQRGYASAFNLNSVYTPQMVVDGHDQFVGGNASIASEAIAHAATESKATIELRAAETNKPREFRLSVSIADVPHIGEDEAGEVLMAITENNLTSKIDRGENGGRTLKHTAVVRQFISVGDLHSGEKTFVSQPLITVNSHWQKPNLRVVVFLQERRSRRVLGAAVLKIVSR